jgi:hypothetical protein
MPLTYDDWVNDLEQALVDHIDHYVPTDVDIRLEAELPRAFTKPVITIGQFDGGRRNTGGMNTVGTKQQGYWETPSYYITVNTDDTVYDTGSPNGKRGRNIVAAQLNIIAFGSQKHNLAMATGGALKIDLQTVGPALGAGPLADRTIYQTAFILNLELIVPFTSLVI